MIYIIDNGKGYEDAQIDFVDAPASFEVWWVETYLPWQKSRPERADKPGLWFELIGIADTIRWHKSNQEDVASFIDKNLRQYLGFRRGVQTWDRPPAYVP